MGLSTKIVGFTGPQNIQSMDFGPTNIDLLSITQP